MRTGTLLLAAAMLLSGCTIIRTDTRPAMSAGPANPAHTDLADELRADVRFLSETIGERSLDAAPNLDHAANFIAAGLSRAGFVVNWQLYSCRGSQVANLEVEIRGETKPDEIIVVGAHYDTKHLRAGPAPGANDNASGTAALLALARRFADFNPERTLRFVFFTNEEPPYFWTDEMGSLVYARAAKDRAENIVAMLSLETMGYYRADPGTQQYPPLVGLAYPSTGDFITFVGHRQSGELVERCTRVFRDHSEVPAEGAALPSLVPRIGSSDHWSFWKQGWPGLMVTDTAPYRYQWYHTPQDTWEKLDYETMARVVEGLVHVIDDLCGSRQPQL